MISQYELYKIKDATYKIPDFNGCRMIYNGKLQSTLITRGIPNSKNYNIIIIIEEFHEPLHFDTPVSSSKSASIPPPTQQLNRTRAGAELAGAGLSCTLAVASGFAVFGSAAAAVPTGGTSIFVTAVAWTGLVTSGLQCINGAVRTYEAYSNPESSSLEQWDSNFWYDNTFKIIDGLGIISGVASIGVAAKTVKAMLTLKGGLPSESVLSAMTNAQRVAAFREAVRRVSQNPSNAAEFSNLLKGMRPGLAKKILKDNAVIIRRTAAEISKEATKALSKNIYEIFVNSSGLFANTLDKESVGSSSGLLHTGYEQTTNYIINITSE